MEGEAQPTDDTLEMFRNGLEDQKKVIKEKEKVVKAARTDLAKEKKIYKEKEKAMLLWQGKYKSRRQLKKQ